MTLDIIQIEDACGRKADLPKYATAGAAAMDLQAFIEAPIVIEPSARKVIKTGLAIAVPAGHAAVVLARSGMATKHGLALANGIGLIDSDYRGELLCSMINLGDKSITINDGDRIAQLLILPIEQVALNLCESLGETQRGCGGFGSTGIGK